MVLQRKSLRLYMLILLLIILFPAVPLYSFDIQAHRGGRDLYPENTLTAFSHAASIGVTTLELDTAVTADGIAVISHDPYLTNKLVRDENGKYVSEYPKLLIRNLTFEELLTYQVGKIKPYTSYARSHKTQKSVKREHIPALSELFALMHEEGYDSIHYNIEIKSYPEFPEYTHSIEVMTEAVLSVIVDQGLEEFCTIQSFDWRTLSQVKEHYPQVKTSCLTASMLKFEGTYFNLRQNEQGPSPWLDGYDIDDYESISDMAADFGTDIISPYYKDITEADVIRAHELGLKIIPWTVNKPDQMRVMIDWGVDGLISDRPDLLLQAAGQ